MGAESKFKYINVLCKLSSMVHLGRLINVRYKERDLFPVPSSYYQKLKLFHVKFVVMSIRSHRVELIVPS